MIEVNASTGRVHGARWQPSPNCDERPDGMGPELLVVHAISLPPRHFGGPFIDDLFTNCLDIAADHSFCDLADARVSAHLLIRRNGAMVQYVSFNQRAWHAGPSSFCGRDACNDFSIGIELEGSDDVAYRDAQYMRLAQLYVGLVVAYPALAGQPVVGHSDIAAGRKTDPGPSFDWTHFAAAVSKAGGAPPPVPTDETGSARIVT